LLIGARVPTGQLVSSSASVAANYRSSESLFWLEYLAATALLAKHAVKELLSESNQLVAIFTTTQKTARHNYARERNLRRARRRATHRNSPENRKEQAVNNQQSTISN
jgi:hypothetical protein